MTKAKLQDKKKKESSFPSVDEIRNKVKENQALSKVRQEELDLVSSALFESLTGLKKVLDDIQSGASTVQKWQYSKRLSVILDEDQMNVLRERISSKLPGYTVFVTRRFEEYNLLVRWD